MDSPIPTGQALGAEIRGVDLAGELEAATVARIRSALLEHRVLIFRDQDLTPAQQVRFASRFGALQRHGYVRGLPGQPDVVELRKEPDHVQNFGGEWHSDNSYLRNPPLGAILYALELPSQGGDTLWANQHAAYDSLPQTALAEIGALRAVHRPEPAFGTMRRLDRETGDLTDAMPDAAAEVLHPLVRTHPETRQKSLFHSGACTARLQGRTLSDSKPFLDRLMAHATQERFTYRHRWREHDVVFWDNRCTMHLALNDYAGQRRVVHRVSIEGDVPF